MKIINSKKTILEEGIFSDLISRLMISGHATRIKAPNDLLLAYQCDVKGVQDYCDLRDGQDIAPGLPFGFWNLWIAANAQFAAANDPDMGIFELEVWIYADVELLEQEVPEGMPNRLKDDEVTVNTFDEWYANPIGGGVRFSNDSLKVVLNTNVLAKYFSMSEINVLLAYCQSSPHNAELCNEVRKEDILESAEFTL